MQRTVTITKRVFKNTKVLVVALPALVAGTGCYQYQPSTLGDLRSGQVVHVELTQPAADALAGSIGPRAASIDGKVLARDATQITLATTQIGRLGGAEEFLRNEPVTLPLSGAREVTVRSLDRPRSWLATGAVIVGAIVAAAFVDHSSVLSAKGGPPANTK